MPLCKCVAHPARLAVLCRGPRATSAAFVLSYETNLGAGTTLPPLNPEDDLYGLCQNTYKNLKFPQLHALRSLFLIIIPLPGVTGCLHSVSIVIHMPSHWNAPMTPLCGHFSFSFSLRLQNDRMSPVSLSALQELNELSLKCFLTIDLKSKSATLLTSKNFQGSQPIVLVSGL